MSVPDTCLFFREDFEGLRRQIESLEKQYKKWGEISTLGKTGDWHDNFNYEEGMRQMESTSRQLRELQQLVLRARVLKEERPVNTRTEKIVVGCRVVLEQENGEQGKYFIGSYRTCRDDPTVDGYTVISYPSPLAQAMIGREAGDVIAVSVGDRETSYRIVDKRRATATTCRTSATPWVAGGTSAS